MENLNSRPPYDFKEGALLLVDKPLEWTSFDVVNKIRYKLKHKLAVKKIKVGHAGTLDPLATGLLLICTGKYTKQIQHLQGLRKSYTGTIKLGATTSSYDAEQPEDNTFPIDHLTPQDLEEARKQFLGDLDQYPPMFSAIKMEGQVMYKLARAGKKVELKPRPIHIFDFNFSGVEFPLIDFEVRCSKGTYIRSLAHDFGKALDNGAYLKALRRTAIGDFSIEDAWALEELIAHIEDQEI